MIAARTGTFYGQRMRKGDIYALPGLAYARQLAVDLRNATETRDELAEALPGT